VQGKAADEGRADALGHHLLDRLEAPQLHHDLGPYAGTVQGPVDARTHGAAGLEHDQGQALELGEPELPPTGQGVGGGHDEHELVVDPWLERQGRWEGLVGDGDHAQVELPGCYGVDHRLAAGLPHVEADAGVLLVKPSKQRRKKVGGGGGAPADGEGAALHALQLLDGRDAVVEVDEQALDVGEEHLPGFGELHALGCAVEQCRTQLGLEPRQLPGHGGLGESQGPRRTGEVTLARDGDEAAEGRELHGASGAGGGSLPRRVPTPRIVRADPVQSAVGVGGRPYVSRMRRWLQAPLFLLAATTAGWLACWQLVVGALWWAGLAALLARSTAEQRVRPWAWAALALTGLPAALWCLVRYGQRVDALSHKVFAGGSEALAVPDMIALWGLNLVMAGAGAVLGFPEVAAETASLAVPNDGTVVWDTRGRFPACVPKIRSAISQGGRRSVAWAYTSDESLRGGLALNPARVRVTPDANGRTVRVTVPVDYPPRSRLSFGALGPVELVVEEGLFHALEERGWLHPYELTYVWYEGEGTPVPPPCEAWSVRWAR